MSGRMWALSQFRFDEAIESAEVYLFDGDGSELMGRDAAIALAHARGVNLVASWPPAGEAVASCVLARVNLPLRWERVPVDDGPPPVDERLWFEASCGGRVGNGHTFVGRLQAWCPHNRVAYNVSFAEMGTMSDESRYFLGGFLAGNEPGRPVGTDGDTDEADLVAWWAATERFRRTGSWYGRWGTCSVCGCVLLPDTGGDRCHEHPQ